ncbi:MAG: sigma-70 factor domain-containing protein, partial [Candidatus Acidiferrales bacterium]
MPLAIHEKDERVQSLIGNKRREARYLLHDEVNDALPGEVRPPEEIRSMFSAFDPDGAREDAAVETAPHEALDSAEFGAPEAHASIASIEGSRGEEVEVDETAHLLDKTNDPVRLYLREMGSVPLLKREGEVVLAKRIERG